MPSPVNGSKKSAASPTRAAPRAQARGAREAKGPVARASDTRTAAIRAERHHAADGAVRVAKQIHHSLPFGHVDAALARAVQQNRVEHAPWQREAAIAETAPAVGGHEVAADLVARRRAHHHPR